MKYFLIAGEASGDLHASNLMRALKTEDKEADFQYFGGDLMQSVGGKLLKHYREMAFMGFIPVLMNLPTILRNRKQCLQAIAEYQPDAVILVDYPGFNLQIAKKIQVPHIFYYISPKLWAWKSYRIRSIKKYIQKLYSILPFEVDFFKKHDYSVHYVGNPTVDALAIRENQNETLDEFVQANQLDNKPIIALLAGSRRQEISANLPAMLESAASFVNDFQLLIAGAPGIEPEYYQQFTANHPVKIVFGQTYRLLQQAHTALVTSGTATLETALMRVPQVVCYKLSFKRITTFLFEHFFSCKYISLVNLIADKPVVKELFGKYFSVAQIRKELDLLVYDENYRRKMDDAYLEVIRKLGETGASERTAWDIFRTVSL